MGERWLVVGGGFRGIIGAFLLASKGKDVTLIESNKHLGGVLHSTKWKGFHLDNGCHIFGNDTDASTSIIMSILGGDVEPVSVHYASITNGKKTSGIAIPDLAAYGKTAARQILYELVEATANCSHTCNTLEEKLDTEYGSTAGGYLATAVKKMYRADAAELDADSFRLTPFRRIRFMEDAVSDILKKSPPLDKRIASSSKDDPMRFHRERAQGYPFRNFYPKQNGMRGFCEKAEERLHELGVAFQMCTNITGLKTNTREATISFTDGDEVSGDHVLWCGPKKSLARTLGEGEIPEYVHHVPMVVYHFVIHNDEEGPYTYMHNYDLKNLYFRASVPGRYGPNTCPPGRSYVCCEVTTTLASPVWCNPENFVDQVWKELQEHEIVRCKRPLDTVTVKTPTSYKMPMVGYRDAVQTLTEYLQSEPRIVCADEWEFSKNDIILSLLETLANA